MAFVNLVLVLAVLAVLALSNATLLRPRHNAPAFKAKGVIDDKFIDIALKDYAEAGKWVVLLFYPFDFTFVCPVSRVNFILSSYYLKLC